MALWVAGVAPGATCVLPLRGCRTEPGRGGRCQIFTRIIPPGKLKNWQSGMLNYPGPGNWKPDAPHGLVPCRVPGFQNFRFSLSSRCSNSLRCRQYARSLNGKCHCPMSSWQFTQVLFPEGPVCPPVRLRTVNFCRRQFVHSQTGYRNASVVGGLAGGSPLTFRAIRPS